MALLSQFLLRLVFGLAVGMGITSSRQVTSGYFRNHLYVTLGLSTLAGLLLTKLSIPAAVFAFAAAAISFVGAACWLYESPRAGKISLAFVAACGLAAAIIAQRSSTNPRANFVWDALSTTSSALVLGLVFASMLLGHWYLNAPGMALEPLRRLIRASALAIVFQAFLTCYGQGYLWANSLDQSSYYWIFMLLRWSFGILFVLALLWMSWRTLDIPNTQSATGILYVAVIGVFVGELAAALLSAEYAVPL